MIIHADTPRMREAIEFLGVDVDARGENDAVPRPLREAAPECERVPCWWLVSVEDGDE